MHPEQDNYRSRRLHRDVSGTLHVEIDAAECRKAFLCRWGAFAAVHALTITLHPNRYHFDTLRSVNFSFRYNQAPTGYSHGHGFRCLSAARRAC